MWDAFLKATGIMALFALYNFIYYFICGHDPSIVHEIFYMVLFLFFMYGGNNHNKGKMA